jgi:hypothetical protein
VKRGDDEGCDPLPTRSRLGQGWFGCGGTPQREGARCFAIADLVESKGIGPSARPLLESAAVRRFVRR